MKNLLKLSLLLSALVVGGLGAYTQVWDGRKVRIPDNIIIVNDLGKKAKVGTKDYAPNDRGMMSATTLKNLQGRITVESDGKIATITYATPRPGADLNLQPGYERALRVIDTITIKLSDVFNNIKDAEGFTKYTL